MRRRYAPGRPVNLSTRGEKNYVRWQLWLYSASADLAVVIKMSNILTFSHIILTNQKLPLEKSIYTVATGKTLWTLHIYLQMCLSKVGVTSFLSRYSFSVTFVLTKARTPTKISDALIHRPVIALLTAISLSASTMTFINSSVWFVIHCVASILRCHINELLVTALPPVCKAMLVLKTP